MRSALIVAKPADFGEAVSLLKKLQCRKLIERNSEVNLGLYHTGRRSPQGGDSPSVVGREAEASKAAGNSPDVYSETPNRSRKQNSSEWEPRPGPSGERGNNWRNNDNRGRNQRNFQQNFVERNDGSYNRQRNGHPYRRDNFRNGGGPARVNFFRAEYNNSHWNGRSRPYWMRQNVSNGYYRPRNNRGGNGGRWNRGRGSNRRRSNQQDGNGNQSDTSNSPPTQSQQRSENQNRRPDEQASSQARLAQNSQTSENRNGV